MTVGHGRSAVMSGCLTDGIRQHVGLGTFDAGLGQLTGDGE